MANESTKAYGDESIVSLKGADRVRKRPSVIFGSDGIDGCEHSFFEILSNSIDEAREGYGNEIIITHFLDHSLQVEDFGRGVPVDYNPKEKRFNWELIYCELYAGGKYKNLEGENYEYSLGLNGLGACATQYASEFMDVTSWYDGFKYSIHFRKGSNVTKAPNHLIKEPTDRKRRGQPTIGGRIFPFLLILRSRRSISMTVSANRQWSMPAYGLFSKTRYPKGALKRRNTSIPTALRIT